MVCCDSGASESTSRTGTAARSSLPSAGKQRWPETGDATKAMHSTREDASKRAAMLGWRGMFDHNEHAKPFLGRQIRRPCLLPCRALVMTTVVEMRYFSVVPTFVIECEANEVGFPTLSTECRDTNQVTKGISIQMPTFYQCHYEA